MIDAVSLSNVRVFRGKHTFQLLPLSTICGVNSSGKSSLLRTLLLLKQSQGSYITHKDEDGLLHFDGSEIDLGEYRSIVSDNDMSQDIEIGLTLPILISPDNASFLHQLEVKNFEQVFDPDAIKGCSNSKYRLISVFRFASYVPKRRRTTRQGRRISRTEVLFKSQGILKEAQFFILQGAKQLLHWSIHIDAEHSNTRVYGISFSRKYYDDLDGKNVIKIEEEHSTNDQVHLHVLMNGILPYRLFVRNRKDDDSAEASWRSVSLPPQIDTCMYQLSSLLDSIHYIAPLRSPARRYYVRSGESGSHYDPAGEFVPFLLYEQNPKVVHISPGTQVIERTNLVGAVNKWLHYLRTGKTTEREYSSEMAVSSIEGILVKMDVASPRGGALHPLSDSGFGYSQVLPILIRVLLAERDDTILIEQPELHLNPALQIRLSEFFVSQMLLNKQIVLETHSEHIVNTIRVLTAEFSKVRGKTNILFFGIDEQSFRLYDLSVRSDGTVPGWPHEFFGEAQQIAGRLLRAQLASSPYRKS